MTVTANWGLPIDLNSLFHQLKKHLIPIGYYDAGILKFEHKGEVFGACYKDLFTNRKATTSPSLIRAQLCFGSRLVVAGRSLI